MPIPGATARTLHRVPYLERVGAAVASGLLALTIAACSGRPFSDDSRSSIQAQPPDWFGSSVDDPAHRYFDTSGDGATEAEALRHATEAAFAEAISFVLVDVRAQFESNTRARSVATEGSSFDQFESDVRAHTTLEARGPLRHARVVNRATLPADHGAVAYVRVQVPRTALDVSPDWFIGCAQGASGDARFNLLNYGRYLFPDHAGLRSQTIDALASANRFGEALGLAVESWQALPTSEHGARVRTIGSAWLSFAESRESLTELRYARDSLRSVGIDGLALADLDARLCSMLLKEADRQRSLGHASQERQMLVEALDLAATEALRAEIEKRRAEVLSNATTVASVDPSSPPDVDGFIYRGRNESETFLYEHKKTGIEFVFVQGGTFTRSDGVTKQNVSLSPYLIGRYEVTRAQWLKVMGEAPPEGAETDLPVDSITWPRALEFCRKADVELPTEAQWEYACRAGGEEPSPSERLELGWHGENSKGRVHAIATARSNPWGLYDTYGNLWEWCCDCFAPYQGRSVSDPVGNGDESVHVLRGGSYARYRSNCGACARFSERSSAPPSRTVGLRVVKSLRSGPDRTSR